jgi:hypothetical protein
MSDTARQVPVLPDSDEPRYTDRVPARAKSKKDTTSDLVAFRLDKALVRRLDAYAASIAASNRGLQVTRTDAVRMLLLQALEATTAKDSAKR